MHSYKQEGGCLVHFVCMAITLLKDEEVHETFLLVTLPNIHRLYIFFTERLSNKPILIWLLTTPSHLKCVATLPCILSLIVCFLTLMLHKIVRQHMHRVVGFLVTSLLQIYRRIFQ